MTVNIPNLTEKIERRIDRNLNKVRDVVPGIVETVHKEKMKIDVYVKTKWADKPTFIKNVRVVYPQSNDSKILYGLSRGDTVLLLFSKFDMISLQNKGLTNVDETPTWESKNVVALPGIHLDQLLQDEYDESSIQGHDVEIPDGLKILSNGNIYLNGEEIFVNDVNIEDFATVSETLAQSGLSATDGSNITIDALESEKTVYEFFVNLGGFYSLELLIDSTNGDPSVDWRLKAIDKDGNVISTIDSGSKTYGFILSGNIPTETYKVRLTCDITSDDPDSITTESATLSLDETQLNIIDVA